MKPNRPDTCKQSEVANAHPARSRDGQGISAKAGAITLAASAYVLGGGGLIAWMGFIILGPRFSLEFGLTTAGSLLVDTLLCLLFFFQHSLMVRRRFRVWLARRIRSDYHGALYASTSGGCLWLLVIFWQSAGDPFWHPTAVVVGILMAIIMAALALGWWGSRALGEFDALGVKPALRAFANRKPVAITAFTVRGPYRWVRHPLYLVSLIILWSGPVFTTDRLLHNLLWSFWIVIGATLEEKDLVACFGDAYRQYQQSVPMLLPKSVRPLVKDIRRYGGDDF